LILGISLSTPDGQQFTPEELLSMFLSKAKTYAEAERRSLLLSAQLAKLKVLQLINSNAAFALNYGVFRRKDFNATVQNILFYDMGASSTIATIASYQLVKTKERGFTETNPQLTIKGIYCF
jgi:hypoxia up-regulated 1